MSSVYITSTGAFISIVPRPVSYNVTWFQDLFSFHSIELLRDVSSHILQNFTICSPWKYPYRVIIFHLVVTLTNGDFDILFSEYCIKYAILTISFLQFALITSADVTSMVNQATDHQLQSRFSFLLVPFSVRDVPLSEINFVCFDLDLIFPATALILFRYIIQKVCYTNDTVLQMFTTSVS